MISFQFHNNALSPTFGLNGLLNEGNSLETTLDKLDNWLYFVGSMYVCMTNRQTQQTKDESSSFLNP